MASKHVFHIKMYRNRCKHSKSVVRLFAYTVWKCDTLITFRVRRSRRGEMYIGHGRLYVCVCLYVCLSVFRRIPTLLHGPGCTLRNGRGCPLVVHYWADLQSVHGFRCYDITAPNAKYQRVLVLALCLELRNFRRGRHLYSTGRPSRWASAITLVCARYSAMSALWDSLIIMSEILRIICNSLFMFDFYSIIKKVAQ